MRRGADPSPVADDLDELQVVTRREFRRGYQAHVDGDLARLRYRKIMATADGHVLVCRPGPGEERRKEFLGGVPRAVALFFVVAWPITLLGLVALVVVLASALG